MKWSKYNTIVKTENKAFVFNYMSNSLTEIDEKLVPIINKNIDNIMNLSKIHEDLFKHFISNGTIVESNFDEVSECIKNINNKLDSREELRLTINPTLDCNLRCWYCYENLVCGSSIADNVIQGIVNYVKGKIQENSVKRVHLSFFGGEPLLKISECILPLLEKLKLICDKNNVKFVHSYTTNSVLLTPKNIDKLLNISKNIHVQVPFDGGEKLHNKIKQNKTGKGTYSLVLNNIKYAINKNIQVNIRCNFTNQNIDSYIELIEVIGKFQRDNVRFSFHKVWQEKETPLLIKKLKKINSYAESFNLSSNILTVLPNINPCYADYNNSILVNFNGDVFKCTARDFNPKNRLGHLTADGKIFYNKNYHIRNECRFLKCCYECDVLPICTVCSQSKFEFKQSCPVNMTSKKSKEHIRKYFTEILYSLKN